MQISKWILSTAGAAMLAMAAGSLSAQAAEKLKIGTEGAYPPFNTITSDGKVVGFDIDIANALCARMKVECEIVTQDWDGIIPALQAKKFDAIIASMSITEERKKQVAFTNKYYTTPLALVAPKDSDMTSTDPAALAGKTVGAQASTTQADYAQNTYGKAGAEAKLYPTQEEAITDLTNGRLDAVISDKFVLVDWLKKASEGCCKLVGDVKGTETQAGSPFAWKTQNFATSSTRPSTRSSPTAPTRRSRPSISTSIFIETSKLPISPLVGEMPGRAEGGAKDRYLSVSADRFEGKTK